ncbi:xylulokinase [Enterococcus ureasiticus]|uniref:ATPase n=1 Tax=Enterococcus ureasiticus TaxID=903984 RepID=A0A1E5GDS8_9ENTE|nr:FGGY-family carbohydrate kinase [Enterococcus ureasiticus]OEG10801.1 ATPase [Enterococcus ureasiticus]
MDDKNNSIKADIVNGRTSLGIEFGSTRIKAVLIGSDYTPIASGSHEWENRLEDGNWTYALNDIWQGLKDSYQTMAKEVTEKYGEVLTTIGSIGFSGMMHGYLAFDKNGELLVPFRTWRNASTEQAEKELTALFEHNIPQRWSIAHLYQAILNDEKHVQEIDYITTLSGYIHWQLTGKKVIGIGDASGMFPIDAATKNYDVGMVRQFDDLIREQRYPWTLTQILPEIRIAGEKAGQLTESGAKLLDISGTLQSGIPMCPPEGDAGTGMVATNSVAEHTGNISAGTSVFAMIVLDKPLKKVYPKIDIVTTPSGSLVAMVHANNCSSEINAWVQLFKEFAEMIGVPIQTTELFETLFLKTLEGDKDCGGLLSYGYYSGENITGIKAGRPLFVRTPESKFNLANFMQVHLYSAFGALKIGMDILLKEEAVRIDSVVGHGGLFKTKEVCQKVVASVMDSPVSVMENAGEGGAWGIALLAAFMREKTAELTLANYLTQTIFINAEKNTVGPNQEEKAGFELFIDCYKKGLPIEQAAVDYLQ